MLRSTYNIWRFTKVLVLLSMCLLIFTACDKKTDDDQTTEGTIGTTAATKEETSDTSYDTSVGPPETTDEGGLLQLLSEKSLEDYSNYEEIIINPSGTSMVFTTNKELQNVKLIGVNYNGDLFDEGLIYYDKETFTPEDAILITTVIPEGMPDLLLSYIDGSGNQKNYYISQNGTDGSLELLAESEILFSETTDSGE